MDKKTSYMSGHAGRTLVGEWKDVKNVIEMEQNKGEVSCDCGI